MPRHGLAFILEVIRQKRERSLCDTPRTRSQYRRRSADWRYITPYDEPHFATHLSLLDVETDGTDWIEVVRFVLHRDPATDAERSRRRWESHLARARWMTKRGYRRILEQPVERNRTRLD